MFNKKRTCLLPVRVISVISKYANHHSSCSTCIICDNNENESMNGSQQGIAPSELMSLWLFAKVIFVVKSVVPVKIFYRWLNKATESSGDKHPDGGSCIISQRRISCSTGFCEVKADYMKNNTVSTRQNLLRLCIFGKDTIENEDVKNIVLLQAVGHRVIVYLYQRHDDSFYAAFEVDSIEVPKSILELPDFIMKLGDIKRLINFYKLFCATEKDKTNFLKRKIPSPSINEMNTIINTRKPKKVKTSLEF